MGTLSCWFISVHYSGGVNGCIFQRGRDQLRGDHLGGSGVLVRVLGDTLDDRVNSTFGTFWCR